MKKTGHLSAYTLAELAMVLLIVAFLAGTGVTVGMAQIEGAKIKQTNLKMQAINDALMAFRVQNDRIPCPADATLGMTNANYGVEAANPGYCMDGTPAANFNNNSLASPSVSNTDGSVAKGAVPFKALNLADEYMYDGWGNKFDYAVNVRLTGKNTFSATPLSENCGGLTVKDATGTANRSAGAAYALISHGKNGHGAYTRAGARFSAASSNADELQNCDCDNTGAATAFNATYTQHPPTDNGAGSIYDDVVTFKERWQMQSGKDITKPPYDGASLVVANGAASPKFLLYTLSCDAYSLVASPATMPPFTVTVVNMSADGNYIIVSGITAPYEYVYQRSTGTTYNRISDLSPASAAISRSIFLSPDGQYLLRSTAAVREMFKLSGDTYTKLTSVTLPAPLVSPDGASWSANGRFLALMGNPPVVYEREGDAFNLLPALTAAPVGAAGPRWNVALSPDGTYLAVGYAVNTVPARRLYLYKLDVATKTYQQLAGVPATDIGAGSYVRGQPEWSSDGKYLSVVEFSSPYLHLYRRDGDTLVDMTTNTSGLLSYGFSMKFSLGSRIMLHSDSTVLKSFRRVDDKFVIMPTNITVNNLTSGFEAIK